MSSPLEIATRYLSELNAKFEAGDVVGGKETLGQIKICMLDFPSTISSGGTFSLPHWKVATEALELGILLTIADGDLDAFARNVAQIKPYYAAANSACTTTTSSTTSSTTGSSTTTKQQSSSSSSTSDELKSPRKCHILGLNLMNLLVDNRLSEFHAELELLTENEASNKFVSFPINLERQLMVGIYDEVLSVTVPDPSYQFFVDNLLQTVRDSIADCIEVSYKNLKCKDAMTMMKFTKTEELLEYIDECRDDWIVNTNKTEICFQPPPSGSKASDIPSMKLIAQSLSYATEMERIV